VPPVCRCAMDNALKQIPRYLLGKNQKVDQSRAQWRSVEKIIIDARYVIFLSMEKHGNCPGN